MHTKCRCDLAVFLLLERISRFSDLTLCAKIAGITFMCHKNYNWATIMVINDSKIMRCLLDTHVWNVTA